MVFCSSNMFVVISINIIIFFSTSSLAIFSETIFDSIVSFLEWGLFLCFQVKSNAIYLKSFRVQKPLLVGLYDIKRLQWVSFVPYPFLLRGSHFPSSGRLFVNLFVITCIFICYFITNFTWHIMFFRRLRQSDGPMSRTYATSGNDFPVYEGSNCPSWQITRKDEDRFKRPVWLHTTV